MTPCVEEVLAGLLDLGVAGERRHDRLVDALAPAPRPTTRAMSSAKTIGGVTIVCQ